MTYLQLLQIVFRARELHDLTGDPLLPSAIVTLTPYLCSETPENIELVGQAAVAAECIIRMSQASRTLYAK